jgi:hypothetical protein
VKLILITFICFVLANVCSTIMVQAESRNRSVIAGTFEAGYALFWIYAAKYALSTSPREIVALVFGNFIGAWIGTKWGEKWVKDHKNIHTLSRIEEVEAELLLAEQSLAELSHEAEIHHYPESHDH